MGKRKRLVPLSRIIGISRGTIGKSVYENVRNMRDGKREPARFCSCFSFLNKMTLEELRESYKNVYPVEMDYYVEEDEYYLTSDGNHRTLTAMLLGAEYINANVTPMYCDFEKRHKCLAVDKFYEDFNIIQNILNMLSRNKRIIQYIEKSCPTNWNREINIYDFD